MPHSNGWCATAGGPITTDMPLGAENVPLEKNSISFKECTGLTGHVKIAMRLLAHRSTLEVYFQVGGGLDPAEGTPPRAHC